MNTTERLAAIRDCLTIAFQPTKLEIIDNSEKHRGHPGAASGAGHYAVRISADLFADKPLLNCHRLIYAALDKLLGPEIHALEISID